MLFFFEELQEVSMWMKDTLIPLDIIFINEDNEVIKVATNRDYFSLQTNELPTSLKYHEGEKMIPLKRGDTIVKVFK